MAKLLYIQASPRKERSKSNQVAAAFLDSYKQTNPDDTVETLNVFEADLPSFDGLTVQAKYTIMHGAEHTAEERQAWDAVETIIEKFKSADKYVISLPMWNFGIPYRLKQYIDILVQPGYTFKVGDNGYEGLVKGKPVVVIYARGGAYLDAVEYDKQKPYMEQILDFIGFEDIRSIVVEPTLAGGEDLARQAVEGSIQKARQTATQF
ncbi:MAG: NAD(P)H-dependent oxidoreductase [Phycisphaerae bacterium]|nr:NAD(P)H-dependent oxidoreductase [Phycisphaerae bacterium]